MMTASGSSAAQPLLPHEQYQQQQPQQQHDGQPHCRVWPHSSSRANTTTNNNDNNNDTINSNNNSNNNNSNNSNSNSNSQPQLQQQVLSVIQASLAVAVAVLVTLLDNFPYGFLLFPMAAELHCVGISMVLMSAASAQFVFGVGSQLPEGLGCMIVENIPMLHSMANSVTLLLQETPDKIVPTVIALYISASLLTSTAFCLLGYLRMDQVFLLLPKPVLMGCIGGMGVYILTAGIGAATNVPWEWSSEVLLLQVAQWSKA
ncbi:unnamed protein product, partial [Polarella glacialis]